MGTTSSRTDLSVKGVLHENDRFACCRTCHVGHRVGPCYPILTLKSDTGSSVTVYDGAYNDASIEDAGVVSYIGRIGNWCINVTTGTSGIGGIGIPELDLSSLDYTSSGPGTLVITLSDQVAGPWSGHGAIASVGGTFNAPGNSRADFKTLIDKQLVSELTFTGQSAGTPFSGSEPFSFQPHELDTVELIATITHAGKGSTSFDYAISPVPEPGTMLLLGAGAFGVAVFGKRRRKNEAI